MKNFLIALLALAVVAAAGAAGYMLYQNSSGTQPAQLVDAPPASSAAADPTAPTIGAVKFKETDADVLEALSYETGKNRDTVGWLQVSGTDIDNSVVQSHDNLYYLRRNERKVEDVYGCYFADSESNLDTRENLSQNTVIYGHSDLKDNPDGPKFSQLFRYTNERFADENRKLVLTTLDGKTEWEVFAAFYTDITFNYIKVEMTDAQKLEIANQALEKSIYDFGVSVSSEDKLLTLSTCSVKFGDDGNQRFVIMARLLPLEQTR